MRSSSSSDENSVDTKSKNAPTPTRNKNRRRMKLRRKPGKPALDSSQRKLPESRLVSQATTANPINRIKIDFIPTPPSTGQA